MKLLFIKLLPVFTLLASFSSSNFAETGNAKRLCDGFFPDSDLSIAELQDGVVQGITHQEFDQAIDKVVKSYEPVFKSRGLRLKVNRHWKDGTVNAYADRDEDVAELSFFGGLARYPKMTLDTYTMIVCHEVGHHLGGLPLYSGDWASTEGQSDYFASLKCMRFVLENENNEAWYTANQEKVDSVARIACELNHRNRNDALICMRSAVGATQMKLIIKDAELKTPRWKNIPKTAIAWHPEGQCRLDTYFAGALCKKDKNDALSNEDVNKGACTPLEGYLVGSRPLCWFGSDSIEKQAEGGFLKVKEEASKLEEAAKEELDRVLDRILF